MMQISPAEQQAVAAYLGPILTGEPSEPIVRQIPVPLLDAVWPHVCDRIAADVAERSRGGWSMEAIADRLLQGLWQLWVIYDGTFCGVLATELYQSPGGLPLARIEFATGSGADRWAHLIGDIEDWARDQGCVRLEMVARKGWARRLKDYKMTHVLLERDLTNVQQ